MEDDASRLGRLRPINRHELELMLTWRNAPTVRANMYTRHEIGWNEHLSWWERTQNLSEHQYFMYELKNSPLGIIAFNGIDTANQNCSWAFYASPDAPKGTGGRMEYLALEHAYENVRLHKLCCEVFAFNTSVIRLHEKFGFRIEGILREHHKIDDKYIDIYRLGMLASEWKTRRQHMLRKLLNLSNK
jgi:UDP-4-amino-4,6-dideoxy-N-acetyl-beta-L-altrosamine N-acetyltransferase